MKKLNGKLFVCAILAAAMASMTAVSAGAITYGGGAAPTTTTPPSTTTTTATATEETVTVLTDTFAYLTGMAIGKHKFTKISPNKTIEGCIGGLLMGSVLTTIFYTTFIGGKSVLIVFPLMLLLSLACEVGDLFFSLIKRENNIKDFSNLIPGHGGVLDRIDSLTFVIWTFMIIMGLI